MSVLIGNFNSEQEGINGNLRIILPTTLSDIDNIQEVTVQLQYSGKFLTGFCKEFNLTRSVKDLIFNGKTPSMLGGYQILTFHLETIQDEKVTGKYYSSNPVDSGKISLVVGDMAFENSCTTDSKQCILM